MRDIFARAKENPLLRADDMPYLVNAVFNAGAADLGDEVLLLLRVESASGRSHFLVARSKNGVTDWKINDHALMHPAEGYAFEANGVEDCRITWMEELGVWALAYTGYSDQGPGVALATTKDFSTVERIGLVLPPEDKNAALFPRKFDGLYAMLHRPSVGGGSIWLSYSPDLIFWGKAKVVVPVRSGPWWDGLRVGAGMPPVETDEGWLVVYHGVKEIARRPLYKLGAALLDLNEPHRLIGRARRWLLGPSEQYERTGDAPNVIFSCGGFVREGVVWLYYGACDSCICLARGKLSEILEVVREEPV